MASTRDQVNKLNYQHSHFNLNVLCVRFFLHCRYEIRTMTTPNLISRPLNSTGWMYAIISNTPICIWNINSLTWIESINHIHCVPFLYNLYMLIHMKCNSIPTKQYNISIYHERTPNIHTRDHMKTKTKQTKWKKKKINKQQIKA